MPALAAGFGVEQFGLEPTALALEPLDVAPAVIVMAAGTVRAHRQESWEDLRPT